MYSYPKALLLIIFLLLVSIICVATVYADVSYQMGEDIFSNDNNTSMSDIITVTMIPSVDSVYDYEEYTQSWINYCPFCHQYGTLKDTPKDPNRNSEIPEGEITCDESLGGCDADFCGVTGKDKNGRDIHLTSAGGSVPISANVYQDMSNFDFNGKFHCRASQISLIDSNNAE